jgi:hypothetical protein
MSHETFIIPLNFPADPLASLDNQTPANMEDGSAPDSCLNIRKLAESRIIKFQLLLLDRLTPLFRTELSHAIKLYSEALAHSNIKSYEKDLDDSYEKLKRHWARIYGDFVHRTDLLHNTTMFQAFLAAKLLEDYANEPYTVNKWALIQAESITRGRDGGDMDAYRTNIVYPLEEMMLNKDSVEQKLLAAATRRSGGNIRPLIDSCDWPKLAAALTDDRDLTLKLDPDTVSLHTRDKILRHIDEISQKYFSQLSSASEFVINKHAAEISALASSRPHDESILMHLNQSNTDPDHASKQSFRWKIYNAITNSIRGSKSSQFHSKKS